MNELVMAFPQTLDGLGTPYGITLAAMTSAPALVRCIQFSSHVSFYAGASSGSLPNAMTVAAPSAVFDRFIQIWLENTQFATATSLWACSLELSA